MLIVPNRGEGVFLDPLPLGVLPAPPAKMLRRLSLFAITQLSGIAQPPHAMIHSSVVVELAVHMLASLYADTAAITRSTVAVSSANCA